MKLLQAMQRALLAVQFKIRITMAVLRHHLDNGLDLAAHGHQCLAEGLEAFCAASRRFSSFCIASGIA